MHRRELIFKFGYHILVPQEQHENAVLGDTPCILYCIVLPIPCAWIEKRSDKDNSVSFLENRKLMELVCSPGNVFRHTYTHANSVQKYIYTYIILRARVCTCIYGAFRKENFLRVNNIVSGRRGKCGEDTRNRIIYGNRRRQNGGIRYGMYIRVKMRQPIPADFLAVPRSPGLMGSARSPS